MSYRYTLFTSEDTMALLSSSLGKMLHKPDIVYFDLQVCQSTIYRQCAFVGLLALINNTKNWHLILKLIVVMIYVFFDAILIYFKTEFQFSAHKL